MIHPLAGWMLVQPLLSQNTANDKLRVGQVHAIGDIHDEQLAERIPFKKGDRVCWIDGIGQVHVLNETLLLVNLGAPLAYEPAENGNGDD
jgi:hypothetical protein